MALHFVLSQAFPAQNKSTCAALLQASLAGMTCATSLCKRMSMHVRCVPRWLRRQARQWQPCASGLQPGQRCGWQRAAAALRKRNQAQRHRKLCPIQALALAGHCSLDLVPDLPHKQGFGLACSGEGC